MLLLVFHDLEANARNSSAISSVITSSLHKFGLSHQIPIEAPLIKSELSSTAGLPWNFPGVHSL